MLDLFYKRPSQAGLRMLFQNISSPGGPIATRFFEAYFEEKYQKPDAGPFAELKTNGF